MPQPIEHARAVLAVVRDQLLARPNVVATGIGLKLTAGSRSTTPCIVCSVAEKHALHPLSLRARVPARIDGVPTDVVETGRLHALAVPTDRHRPAPGGVSIGHVAVTAGTLACVLRRNGEPMILSNNHVLANGNHARLGDPILQPGPHDGGRLAADQIAELADFVPISFLGVTSAFSLTRASATMWNRIGRLLGSRARLRAVSERVVENRVDAAIARPLRAADVSEEILELGPIVDVASAELGLPVRKSGRTTGVTRGEILQVDVTAKVHYGPGQLARFTDQLLAGPMSEGGDSGSAVLDEHGRLVGLLFAGSENTTIINRIEHVFEALRLELPPESR
jgi:hypothetical protein